jgi:hypothetical protein
MSATQSTVQLPHSIAAAAIAEAARQGLSLEEWTAATVAKHLRETAAAQAFFQARAAGVHSGALREALDAIPDRAPDPEDR